MEIAARQYADRDVPFRDPILYPGVPMEPAIGRWTRLQGSHECVIGGEVMEPGEIARWRGPGKGWECRACVWGGTDCPPPAENWRQLVLPMVCNLGGESMPVGTVVRRSAQVVQGIYECRDHVRGAAA